MGIVRDRGLRDGCGPMLPPTFAFAFVIVFQPGLAAGVLAAKVAFVAAALFTLSGRVQGFRLPNPSRALRIALRYEVSYWLLATLVALVAIASSELLHWPRDLEFAAWCVVPFVFFAGRRACLASALRAHEALEPGVAPRVFRLMLFVEVGFWLAALVVFQLLQGLGRTGSTPWMG